MPLRSGVVMVLPLPQRGQRSSASATGSSPGVRGLSLTLLPVPLTVRNTNTLIEASVSRLCRASSQFADKIRDAVLARNHVSPRCQRSSQICALCFG